MSQRYYIETFGCQMNVNDSEKVAGLFQKQGFSAAESAEDAEVVFVNTCAVREKAAEKLYHSLGRLKRLKRDRPELVVSVGGCVAQLEGTRVLERSGAVDVLVGTHNISSLPDLIQRARQSPSPLVELDRKADAFAVPDDQIAHSNPVRAYVTIMEGCNHVCGFCVVPRTRGPEVNRPPLQVLGEVRSLVDRGFAEVMLLGQTVNAYEFDGLDFAGLLEKVHEIPGLRRLRFTTSHPEHVDVRLAAAFRDLPRLGGYLHLPVQSGSSSILARMRRGYSADEYLERVSLLRGLRSDLALSSDIIVGYPGETIEDFEATLRLVEAADFESLFSFTYSSRPGTTAAREVDDVPEAEKKRRLHVLGDLQQRRQLGRNRRRVGERHTVLVDTLDGDGRVSGRTPHFRLVHLDGGSELLGREIEVEISVGGANAFQGRRIGAL